MVKTGGIRIIAATLFSGLGIVALISLGLWQLDRKAWKENLIATLNARLTQAPQELPKPAEWPQLTPAKDEYRRVIFTAELPEAEPAFVYTAGSSFRPDVQGAGYWVFAPARLSDGRIVVVNRGFVPLDRKNLVPQTARTDGPIWIIGSMRWADERGRFTPIDQPQENVWYSRDPQAKAKAKQWGITAPFYIEQESPSPPGGWPKPGKLHAALPNNHLQYALTWFGLALALAGVYGFWLIGTLRSRSLR